MRTLLSLFVVSIMLLASCSDSNYSGKNKSGSNQKKTSYAKHYDSGEDSQLRREVFQKQDRIEQMLADMDGMLKEEGIQ